MRDLPGKYRNCNMKVVKQTDKTILYQDGNLLKVYVKQGVGQPRQVLQTSNAGTATKAFDFYEKEPNGKFPI